MKDFIKIKNTDFFDTKKTNDKNLHLIINPPYGERLNGGISDLYSSIGNTLKKQYTNSDAWIISSNFEAIKQIGLKPKLKIKLFNGKLESRLLNFPIYEGTKKK